MTDAQPAAPSAKRAAPPRKLDVLDKSRPYGYCVSAVGHPEIAFVQDGKNYDHEGIRIVASGDATVDAAREAEEAKRIKQKLAKAKAAVAALEAGEDPEPDEESTKGVNLYLWATGKVNYRFAVVRHAIEDRYSRSVHNEVDAREFLIDAKLVTTGEVRQFLNASSAAA